MIFTMQGRRKDKEGKERKLSIVGTLKSRRRLVVGRVGRKFIKVGGSYGVSLILIEVETRKRRSLRPQMDSDKEEQE